MIENFHGQSASTAGLAIDDTVIVPMTADMVRGAARVHLQALADSRTALMGETYVRAFIDWFRQTGHGGIALAAIDLRGDGSQPRPAIFVSQRLPGAHLGNVACGVEFVAVLIAPAEAFGERIADRAFARPHKSGKAHDRNARKRAARCERLVHVGDDQGNDFITLR